MKPHYLDCSTIQLRSRLLSRTARKRSTAAPAGAGYKATQREIPAWLEAARAAESKKAADIRVLDLREITSFTDYFILCTGANQRQIQAIGDEVAIRLKSLGRLPMSVEGYDAAEWILADYGDFIVHIFSEKARAYYDLDRLWRQAKAVEIPAAQG